MTYTAVIAPEFLRRTICKGCHTFIQKNNGPEKCQIPPINEHGEHCPCSICMVKMMCENSCESLHNYQNHKKEVMCKHE